MRRRLAVLVIGWLAVGSFIPLFAWSNAVVSTAPRSSCNRAEVCPVFPLTLSEQIAFRLYPFGEWLSATVYFYTLVTTLIVGRNYVGTIVKRSVKRLFWSILASWLAVGPMVLFSEALGVLEPSAVIGGLQPPTLVTIYQFFIYYLVQASLLLTVSFFSATTIVILDHYLPVPGPQAYGHVTDPRLETRPSVVQDQGHPV